MYRIIIFFIGILVVISTSCTPEITGEGGISTQVYTPITNFTKVSVDHNIDVKIAYGGSKKVEVTGYDNLLDYVKISASGGVLKIGMKPNYTYPNLNITAKVIMPIVTELSATSGGNISIDSFTNKFTTLTLNATNSGNISSNYGIFVGTLISNISSTGSMDLNGVVDMQEINISGSGNYNAFYLYSNNTIVNSLANGDAKVNAKILLTSIIASTGNVYYKRTPELQTSITGTGLVIDAN